MECILFADGYCHAKLSQKNYWKVDETTLTKLCGSNEFRGCQRYIAFRELSIAMSNKELSDTM